MKRKRSRTTVRGDLVPADDLAPADDVFTQLFSDLQLAGYVRTHVPEKVGFASSFERQAWVRLMEHIVSLPSLQE